MKIKLRARVLGLFGKHILFFRSYGPIVAGPPDLPTSSGSFRITLPAGNKSSALRVIYSDRRFLSTRRFARRPKHTHTHTRNKTTRTDNERQTHAHKNKRHTHNRQLNALFHANFQVKFNNSVQPITVSVFVDLIDLLYCRIR